MVIALSDRVVIEDEDDYFFEDEVEINFGDNFDDEPMMDLQDSFT